MNKIKPYIAISYTLLFWGISFISTKICLGAFSVYSLIFGRFAIAAVILFIVKRKIEPHTRLLKQDLPNVLIAGLVGFTGYYVFEAVGVDLTGASMASILLSMVPIFCVITDTLLYKQKFTFLKGIGVFLSVIGVILIVGLSELQINPWGCGAMILSAIGWLLYNYKAKPLYARYTGLDMAAYLSACIAGITLPLAIIYPPDFSLMTPQVLLNFLFLAILVSGTANLTYMYALKFIPMLTVTILVNFVPVVTIIFSTLFLKESLTAFQLLGAGLVILSVCLAGIPERKIEQNVGS
ncbi:MAG: EamA family transporter [Eubacterium sp.]